MLRRRFLLISYAVLLLVSHTFIRFSDALPSMGAGQQRLSVLAPAACAAAVTDVKIAFSGSGKQGDGRSVVLLLHGSPIGATLLRPLAAELSAQHRVILPDLPGFAASAQNLPDYSIRAHACYMAALLRQLQIAQVHIVGYSMGAGVAIELAERLPQSVLSVTLVSGIGAQQHELTGNYHLNHLLHGVQLGFFWLLQNFLPHFGLLDLSPLNYRYARNFYDTDQRPLSGYLGRLSAPLLLLHGDEDMLVPVTAALAHQAIQPRSQLRIFPGEGHLFVYDQAHEVAKTILPFIAAAEQGTFFHEPAPVFPLPLKSTFPVMLLLLLAFATLLSEDLTCIAAGALVANGNLHFAAASAACFTGIFAGDVLLLLLGRGARRSTLLRSFITRVISPQRLADSATWLERRGVAAIIASRFMPGTRLPLYVSVGFLGRANARYIVAFAFACAIWTPALVALAWWGGDSALSWFSRYEQYSTWIVLGIVLAVVLFRKILLPLFTWRGRRLLLSRSIRLTHWEFWPAWIFYIPLVFYILYLMLRYRSATVFTAANPGIPDGGFIGESKAAILHALGSTGRDVARFTLLPPGDLAQRMHTLSAFMRRYRLQYPFVLKPDVGERGNEVAIVEGNHAAEQYLQKHSAATIAQQYIHGCEYGVFYMRMPGAEKGKIFAITDKRFPALTGDGVQTLEQLILSDGRALSMARFHLTKYHDRLQQVVPAGERFKLVELGTHCKGSLFLDGMHLATPALEKRIDTISRRFDGFFFGRYDIRVPTAADFRRGRNLKIVELNGVTSEATSIYDPKNSLFYAYKLLAQQWQLAFEIGHLNTTRGFKATGLIDLVRHIRSARTP